MAQIDKQLVLRTLESPALAAGFSFIVKGRLWPFSALEIGPFQWVCTAAIDESRRPDFDC